MCDNHSDVVKNVKSIRPQSHRPRDWSAALLVIPIQREKGTFPVVSVSWRLIALVEKVKVRVFS